MSDARRHEFRAIEPHERFTILLVAASPPVVDPDERGLARGAGGTSPAGTIDAVISVARAVLAEGGRIVMPGDRGMSPIVASVALDYAALAATERDKQPPAALVVASTLWPELTLAALLEPYVLRGAVLHVGPDGDPVEPADDRTYEREIDTSYEHRQPVVPWLIEQWRPAGAVFVAPEADAQHDMELLRDSSIAFAVLAHADAERAKQWREHDAARLMMAERPARWANRDDVKRGPQSEDVVPYAYIAQRLVSEWTRKR